MTTLLFRISKFLHIYYFFFPPCMRPFCDPSPSYREWEKKKKKKCLQSGLCGIFQISVGFLPFKHRRGFAFILCKITLRTNLHAPLAEWLKSWCCAIGKNKKKYRYQRKMRFLRDSCVVEIPANSPLTHRTGVSFCNGISNSTNHSVLIQLLITCDKGWHNVLAQSCAPEEIKTKN